MHQKRTVQVLQHSLTFSRNKMYASHGRLLSRSDPHGNLPRRVHPVSSQNPFLNTQKYRNLKAAWQVCFSNSMLNKPCDAAWRGVNTQFDVHACLIHNMIVAHIWQGWINIFQ